MFTNDSALIVYRFSIIKFIKLLKQKTAIRIHIVSYNSYGSFTEKALEGLLI